MPSGAGLAPRRRHRPRARPARPEPIWTEKNETANRVRQRMESVLDWAKVRGFREGDNPARWKGYLDKVLPAPGKVRTCSIIRRCLMPRCNRSCWTFAPGTAWARGHLNSRS